jgi:hypothetical protein
MQEQLYGSLQEGGSAGVAAAAAAVSLVESFAAVATPFTVSPAMLALGGSAAVPRPEPLPNDSNELFRQVQDRQRKEKIQNENMERLGGGGGSGPRRGSALTVGPPPASVVAASSVQQVAAGLSLMRRAVAEDPREANYAEVSAEATRVAVVIGSAVQTERQAFLADKEQAARRRQQNAAFLDQWRGGLLDELGLDVDAAYNKAKRSKRALQLLLYFVYSVKMRVVLGQWRQYSEAVQQQRRASAAASMNRLARGLLARRHVATIRANIARQRAAEQLHQRQRQAFINFSASKIALCYRRYKKRLVRVAHSSPNC